MPTNLRKYREARGLSMRQLGDILDLTHQSVYHWEIKGTRPRRATIARLELLFGVPIDELLAVNENGAASPRDPANVSPNPATESETRCDAHLV